MQKEPSLFSNFFDEKETSGDHLLHIYVVPNAKKTQVLGMHDGALKIALHAKPIEGEANRALIMALSEYYKVPKSKIEIIKGLHSRRKVVRVKIS